MKTRTLEITATHRQWNPGRKTKRPPKPGNGQRVLAGGSATGVEKLVLDMSDVKFLDSAGIGALVRLFVHRKDQSQKFALAALPQQGKAAMQVAGLLNALPAYPSLKEAMDQMA